MFDIIEASPFFQIRNTLVTVTSSPTPICGNEPQRVVIYITNGSPNPVGVFLGPTGLFNQPFYWIPQQSTVRFQWPLDGFITTLPLWGSVGSTTANITVTEVWFRPPKG